MSTFRGTTVFDRLPPGCKNLLLANGVVFLATFVGSEPIEFYLGLTPINVIHKFWVWQLFTYAFVHVQFFHFFFNMFALWMFGAHIESYWGTKTFLRYYFLCALGAAAAQLVIAPSSTVIGASGAIYGLLLAFGLLFPDSVMYMFFFFPMRAIQAVMVIAVMAFVSSVGSGGSRIAHMAHLGGMLTGFLYFKLPMWANNISSWRARRGGGGFHLPKGIGVIKPNKEEDLTSEVDRILEKISIKGIKSLTDEEHATMQRYSQKKS